MILIRFDSFPKRIVSTAVAIMILGIFSYGTMAAPLSEMTLVAENEYLALYINETNAEVAVMDKESRQVWYSNPQNWNSAERIAHGTTKNQLGAQFLITYDRDNSEISRDSYNHSVLLEQFTVRAMDEGVRVNYIINDLWQSDDYIPQVISQERMETAILSELSERDQSTILNNYILFMLVEHTDERVDVPGLRVRNLSKERIFGDYTLEILDSSYQKRLADAQELKVQIDQIQEEIAALHGDAFDEKASLEKQLNTLESNYTRQINTLNKEKADLIWDLLNKIADTRVNYTRLGLENIRFEHVKQFINRPTYILKQTPPFIRQNMVKILKTTSYTPEDVIEDHVANNVNPPYPNIEVFDITVEYLLDQDTLIVSIPLDEIHYPDQVPDVDGIRRTYPLKTIRLLPFFGAADMASEGYLFVPDGSGALVPFKHEPNTSTVVRCPIYGRDSALDPLNTVSVIQQPVHLPVFGMRKDDGGFIAIVEDGDALSTIVADVAGNRFSYNFIYPEITVLNRGRVGLERVGYINTYQNRPYQGAVRIRYKFLKPSESDYVAMAKYYQQYLIDRYKIQAIETSRSMPLFVDLIGAISVVRPVFGISRLATVPLTTYAQAQAIVEALLSENIDHIYLRYTGMLSGGIRHVYPNKFAPEKSLGSQKDFTSFLEFLDQNQVQFYLNVDFMNVYDSSWFSGFSSKRDAARLLDDSPAVIYNYDLASGQRIFTRVGYYLSPSRMGTVMDDFVKDLDPFKIKGLSLANFGSQLYSDFSRDPQEFIDRQQSSRILQAQMEELNQKGLNVMVEGGNAIALPYVNSVIGVPMDTSGYAIASERVPFLQIVLKGLYPFTGQPLNLSSNLRQDILKAIEVGAGIQFVWSSADSATVKETDFDALLSLCYRDWLEQAIEIYQEVNAVSKLVQGARIIGHQKLAPNVYQTQFDNGYAVVVNYNDHPVQVGEMDLGAEDYLLLRGGM